MREGGEGCLDLRTLLRCMTGEHRVDLRALPGGAVLAQLAHEVGVPAAVGEPTAQGIAQVGARGAQ